MSSEVQVMTKLTGVTFNNRQQNIVDVVPKQKLFWRHEADNQYDANAILVFLDEGMTRELGHLSRGRAKQFVEELQAGSVLSIYAKERTGGEYPKSWGLNVVIQVDE